MNIFSIFGAALLTVVLCTILKTKETRLAQHLSSIAAISILIAAVTALSPMISYLKALSENSGADETATGAVMKAIAISLLSQTVCDICADNGEKTLASAVELSGNVSVLLLALPFIKKITDGVLGILK